MQTRFLALVFCAQFGLAAAARAEDKQETLKATVVEQKDAPADKTATDKTAATPTPDAGPFANTACTNGKNKRLVELSAGDKAAKKACEVHYKKETEMPGHDQVIYTSANDPTFCETKAKEFVTKLAGWGWSCAKL